MGKFFVVVAVLLMLAGGGAGGYFYFTSSAEASVPEDGSHEVSQHDDVKGKHGASLREFVELSPLILPVVGEDGVSQVISLVVALEVSGPHDVVEVKRMMPKLQDAFIQDMYGVLGRQVLLKRGVIEVEHIKRRLNRASEKVLGEGVVHDVLLQVVQQRPI